MIAFNAGIAAGGSHGGGYSFELWPGFGRSRQGLGQREPFQVLLASPAHVLLVWVAFMIGSSYRKVFVRRRA